MERGEFSACGSPTGLDSRDPYDLQFGAGMFCNTQDMLWRRKIEEQTDLQQAIELQGRRLMGLQLLDVKRQSHHRTLSTGAAIRSPTRSPDFFSQTLIPPVDYGSPEVPKVNGSTPAMADPAAVVGDQEPEQTLKLTDKESDLCTINDTNENGNGKGSLNQHEESKLTDSLEHNLPDSPFASPKAAGVYTTTFKPNATQMRHTKQADPSPKKPRKQESAKASDQTENLI
ncbi:hypothetical protein U1Q18_037914 [Sarracenia purpurea var. burkii]